MYPITKVTVFPGHPHPYQAVKKTIIVLATVIKAPMWAKAHAFTGLASPAQGSPDAQLLDFYRLSILGAVFNLPPPSSTWGKQVPFVTRISTQGQRVIILRLFFNWKSISSFWGKEGEEWGKREDTKETENDGQLVDKGSSEVEMKASISLQTDKFMHCTRMSQAVIIKRITDT